jgi:hypothetical protein
MADHPAGRGTDEREPVSGREWVKGIVVVVGISVLGTAGAIWILAGLVFGCGCTRPAPGY